MYRLLIVMATVLMGTAATMAWGVPILPPATESVLCSSNNPPQTVTDPSSCMLGGASASVETLPFVHLEAHSSAPAFVASFNTIATLTYSFEVVGGSVGDRVPLLIAASLDTAATPHSFAAALMDVTTSLGSSLTRACTDGSCPGTNFDRTISLQAVSGQIGSLELTIQAATIFLFDGTASAFADPHIFVDPNFVGAGNYSIVLSENVGNGIRTIPEPTSLALLGVSLLGFAGARRLSGHNC
jgi:PEP-CTERM motif-containing protein